MSDGRKCVSIPTNAASGRGGQQSEQFAVHLEPGYKDFDLDLSDKVSVRKMSLGTEYDDKGNVKTYTKEEKDKLKGNDTSKPGYEAKIDDLQSGQQVKIQLKMPKKANTASEPVKKDDKVAKDKDKADDKADPPPANAKKADKGDEKVKDEVVKPVVTMVVILSSLDMVADAAPPKKKKDK